MITLLYFASLRERMGRAEETLALPEGVASIHDLLALLTARDPAGAAAFAHRNLVRAAINQQFANADSPIRDGDEVAFFPPVTGG